jgi:hypothetical protein
MEYKNRAYPIFSACGLNCGLCPNYHIHTDGQFKCPGCGGEGFSEQHPACGILTCCERKGIEYCSSCAEFPCKKYDGWGEYDSFITHRNHIADMEKAKQIGIDAYVAEQTEKIGILRELLNNCNDGRRKTFFCLAVNLLDLQDIQTVLDKLDDEIQPEMPIKQKAATAVQLFNNMAEKRAISLKMRKNPKSS